MDRFTLLAALSGTMAGSFTGLVIDRFQPQQTAQQWFSVLVKPRSYCFHCHRILAWRDLLPLISWCSSGGKCRICRAPIPRFLPACELFTALLFVLLAALEPRPAPLLALTLFSLLLVLLSEIDRRHCLLPDVLTLSLLWAGLLFHTFFPTFPLHDAILGAVAGYLYFWLPGWLFLLYRGEEGIGGGDMKLFAALGAWCGWQTLPVMALLAALIGILCWLYRSQRGVGQQKTIPQPFGPSLAIAGWLVFIAQHKGYNVMTILL
ncbi:Type 4 prepilin-like proteins leader peptide-processing enzyme [Paramixta manurensis]|uniref:Prepilin leader peptidase/N-methyltransferase n=1 Tax=Paramixta manurensis TaxID=2740817 RepID=A0A6M8UF16_9GAMM|nr:Type 4 prepilin-like proteins leader peptide-processing enzyme [Erwiniaceae bacterium PD-1]